MADQSGGADLATQKGAAQTLGQLVATTQREGYTIGTVFAVNNIPSANAIQVFANPATTITWLVFHNPSNSIELLVWPLSLGLAAVSFTTRGGGFLLLPGDFLPLAGNVSYAWAGIAQSGTNNALTITTSPT